MVPFSLPIFCFYHPLLQSTNRQKYSLERRESLSREAKLLLKTVTIAGIKMGARIEAGKNE